MAVRKRKGFAAVLIVVSMMFSASCDMIGREKVPEPITLRIQYYPYADDDWFDRYLATPVKRLYPNIRLEKRTGLQVFEGAPPDVVVSPLSVQVEKAIDLKEFAASGKLDTSAIAPYLLEQSRPPWGGDSLYGVPLTSAAPALCINKNVFKQLHLPLPYKEMTIDQLVGLGKDIQDRGKGAYLSTDIGKEWLEKASGIRYYDGEKPMVLSQKDQLASLRSAELALQELRNAVPEERYKKKIDGSPNYISIIDNIAIRAVNRASNCFDRDGNWDAAPFPVLRQGATVPLSSVWEFVSIARTTPYVEESLRVLEYMLTPAFQAALSRRGERSVLKDPTIDALFLDDVPAYKTRNWLVFVPPYPDSAYPINPYDSYGRMVVWQVPFKGEPDEYAGSWRNGWGVIYPHIKRAWKKRRRRRKHPIGVDRNEASHL